MFTVWFSAEAARGPPSPGQTPSPEDGGGRSRVLGNAGMTLPESSVSTEDGVGRDGSPVPGQLCTVAKRRGSQQAGFPEHLIRRTAAAPARPPPGAHSRLQRPAGKRWCEIGSSLKPLCSLSFFPFLFVLQQEVLQVVVKEISKHPLGCPPRAPQHPGETPQMGRPFPGGRSGGREALVH